MNRSPKPRSVTVFQGILLVLGLLSCVLFVLVAGELDAFSLIFTLGFVLLLFSAVSGMAVGRNSGRWLAVACFVILTSRSAWNIARFMSLQKTEMVEMHLVAVIGVIAFFVCLSLIFAAAALFLAFSPSVKAYFVPQAEPAESVPPPPPTFDD